MIVKRKICTTVKIKRGHQGETRMCVCVCVCVCVCKYIYIYNIYDIKYIFLKFELYLKPYLKNLGRYLLLLCIKVIYVYITFT